MRDTLGSALVGLLLGFSLSRMGFSSWDEVHGMFTFADLRLFLTFITAVVLLSVVWRVVYRVSVVKPRWKPRSIHRGTLAGGALFGVGWALSGACPGVVLVQIGEGQFGAAWTLAGVLLGNFAYSAVHARYFRWSTASCSDE